MCLQESRLHAICNHTILTRSECPDKCAQYDIIETQMPAYCHACRRHVDAQGVTARHQSQQLQQQNRLSRRPSGSNYNKRTSSAPPTDSEGRALAGSQSFDSLRNLALAAAASPAPTGRLPDPPAGGARRQLGMSASASDLHRTLSDRSRKASMGMILSGLAQGQEQQPALPQRPKTANDAASDGRQPEMLSPIPKKPLLHLRIPEESVIRLAADPRTSSSPSSSSRSTTMNEATDPKTLASPVTKTPNTPPSSVSEGPSFSSKLPRTSALPDSRPAVENLPLPAAKTWFHDLRKGFGMRRAKSPGRVVPVKPKVVVEATSAGKTGPGTNNNSNHNDPPTSAVAASAALPQPASSSSPELTRPQTARSSRALFDGSEYKKGKKLGQVSVFGAKKISATPPLRKPSGAVNHFPPASKRKPIDIHDADWLASHGLKWDVHGLGVVSAAVR